MQRHQNSLKGIELEINLRRAQEELDAARVKELEQSRTESQVKIQSEIVRLRELETDLLSKESERHRTVQSRISDMQIRLQQWDESLDVWNQLPPLDSSKRQVYSHYSNKFIRFSGSYKNRSFNYLL